MSARQTRPLVAGTILLSSRAFVLLSHAVEVRMLQELLARQPLRRVHPEAALHHPHGAGSTSHLNKEINK